MGGVGRGLRRRWSRAQSAGGAVPFRRRGRRAPPPHKRVGSALISARPARQSAPHPHALPTRAPNFGLGKAERRRGRRRGTGAQQAKPVGIGASDEAPSRVAAAGRRLGRLRPRGRRGSGVSGSCLACPPPPIWRPIRGVVGAGAAQQKTTLGWGHLAGRPARLAAARRPSEGGSGRVSFPPCLSAPNDWAAECGLGWTGSAQQAARLGWGRPTGRPRGRWRRGGRAAAYGGARVWRVWVLPSLSAPTDWEADWGVGGEGAAQQATRLGLRRQNGRPVRLVVAGRPSGGGSWSVSFPPRLSAPNDWEAERGLGGRGKRRQATTLESGRPTGRPAPAVADGQPDWRGTVAWAPPSLPPAPAHQ